MQVSASPCSAQLRRNKTRFFFAPTSHTSAGKARRQTGAAARRVFEELFGDGVDFHPESNPIAKHPGKETRRLIVSIRSV
jgi:hypothetical protein